MLLATGAQVAPSRPALSHLDLDFSLTESLTPGLKRAPHPGGDSAHFWQQNWS